MFVQLLMLGAAANALRVGSELVNGPPSTRAVNLIALERSRMVLENPGRFSDDERQAARSVVDAREAQIQKAAEKQQQSAPTPPVDGWLANSTDGEHRADVTRDQLERERRWAIAVIDDPGAHPLERARAEMVLGAQA